MYYTIETERLILKRLTPDDFIFLFENYSEDEIKRFLGYTKEEEFIKEKNKYENGYTNFNRSFEYFQMMDKETKTIFGGLGFHNWFLDHRRAELGYAIRLEDFKNKGFMTEALKPILKHGFEKMNLHRIEALIAKDNVPSLKLMETFKFVEEGTLREHYFINNQFEDSVVFSKLKSDWITA